MDIVAKIREFVKRYQRDIFLYVCMLLVAGIGYNLGRINFFQKPTDTTGQEANIYQQNQNSTASQSIPLISQRPVDPRVVASKNSKAKVYYYQSCGTANRIKDTNKIWFSSAQAAETAGYTLAGNCTP